MTVANMTAAALDYARQGLAVFPVWPALPFPKGGGFICGCGRLNCDQPAKHPIGRLAPHGLNDATVDAERVRHLWGARPDANIGFATGAIVAIDIDPRHGGTIEAIHEPLPATWRVTTGGGGLHLYFRSPGGEIRNTASKLAAGIDTRGVGGYTILPPSSHVSGRCYSWEPNCGPGEMPLAALPSSIAARLAAKKQATLSAADWHELVKSNIVEGKRNQTVTRLAGHLLRRYVEPQVVLELLLAWNIARCNPPLSASEVTRTVNSIAGREFQRRNRP